MGIDKHQPDKENDLTALERRLAAWRPAIDGLDRDRILFEAGRASARRDRPSRLWQFATVALILISAGLTGLLAHERSQRFTLETALAIKSGPAEAVPQLSLLAQTQATEILAPNSYFELTAHLMARDLEALAPALGNDFKPAKPDSVRLPPPPVSSPFRPRDLNHILDL